MYMFTCVYEWRISAFSLFWNQNLMNSLREGTILIAFSWRNLFQAFSWNRLAAVKRGSHSYFFTSAYCRVGSPPLHQREQRDETTWRSLFSWTLKAYLCPELYTLRMVHPVLTKMARWWMTNYRIQHIQRKEGEYTQLFKPHYLKNKAEEVWFVYWNQKVRGCV